ncbi:hypothetical protein KP509_36G046900 [Ceratopteris richardii]|uniref:Uncharacterized protein n=1 Tax=Ceratopteris richardii TaxID=49495 RepID=A0A8T2QCK3_CERRI|nr:hypothetical protein KP509_36G046900 [Ceratopteris richardii]
MAATMGGVPTAGGSVSGTSGTDDDGNPDLDKLLDSFHEAATRSIAAAEAAAQAETMAAVAAEEAAAAYLAAADAVGTPDFERLRGLAEKAESLLDALTLAAATASQQYIDASAESMHVSSATYEAAMHVDTSDDDREESDEDRNDNDVSNGDRKCD